MSRRRKRYFVTFTTATWGDDMADAEALARDQIRDGEGDVEFERDYVGEMKDLTSAELLAEWREQKQLRDNAPESGAEYAAHAAILRTVETEIAARGGLDAVEVQAMNSTALLRRLVAMVDPSIALSALSERPRTLLGLLVNEIELRGGLLAVRLRADAEREEGVAS